MRKKKSLENRSGRPSQIDLITAIFKALARDGFPLAEPRHTNAIIRAADLICDEYARAHIPATPGMGLSAWLRCDETGVSSLALHWALRPSYNPPGPSANADHPADPSDFGRCIGLLDAVPAYRDRLHFAAALSPEWSALIEAWAELEALYRAEKPSGECPKLYTRMRELTERKPDA